jgi:hypothetical protein
VAFSRREKGCSESGIVLLGNAWWITRKTLTHRLLH